MKDKTGATWPQRIYTVNGAFATWKKPVSELPPGTVTFKHKRPGRVKIYAKGAPQIHEAIKSRQFKLMTIAGPKDPALRRTEVVLIGDSQLHSAVFGAGLPAFYMAEVGGLFRWGSKSWSGFSPPDIYQEVVPKGAVAPRVVVLSFLPKYFWHSYHTRGKDAGKINEGANKCKPRPLPPVDGQSGHSRSQPGHVDRNCQDHRLVDKADQGPRHPRL